MEKCTPRSRKIRNIVKLGRADASRNLPPMENVLRSYLPVVAILNMLGLWKLHYRICKSFKSCNSRDTYTMCTASVLWSHPSWPLLKLLYDLPKSWSTTMTQWESREETCKGSEILLLIETGKWHTTHQLWLKEKKQNKYVQAELLLHSCSGKIIMK